MCEVSVKSNFDWWKGKQVRILYELVTVFCKLMRYSTGEPGRRKEAIEQWAGRPAFHSTGIEYSGHEELAVRNRLRKIAFV